MNNSHLSPKTHVEKKKKKNVGNAKYNVYPNGYLVP